MIILDTNVLSELVKPVPAPQVVQWLDTVDAREVVTTAVTAAELWYGVRRMPAGKRRSKTADAIDAMLSVDLGNRVEAFDTAAASRYADIVIERQNHGRPIGLADAQIAAICATRYATLATRNIKDFTDTGVELINPWDYQSAARDA